LNAPKKKVNQDLVNLYDVIENLVRKGANLVSNIRKISSIDEVDNSLMNIEIFPLIDNAIKKLYTSFPKKKIKIKYIPLKKAVNAKANELLQDVFENILYNSVKHNKNHPIKIEIRVNQEAIDNRKFIKIEFLDNGVGIPDTHKTIIFQQEIQEARSFNRLGLGISLVKKLIESYHGKIWVENRVKGKHSEGSRFIILIEEW
jgi:signal transduction histidine kinase